MRGSYLNDPCRELRTGEPDDNWKVEPNITELEGQIAQKVGTCCSDPTPEADRDPLFPRPLYYCQACDADLTLDQYSLLIADLSGIRAQISKLRTEMIK